MVTVGLPQQIPVDPDSDRVVADVDIPETARLPAKSDEEGEEGEGTTPKKPKKSKAKKEEAGSDVEEEKPVSCLERLDHSSRMCGRRRRHRRKPKLSPRRMAMKRRSPSRKLARR